MQINSVGVIGAGTMGNGIAQVCAMAGVEVVVLDISEAATERGMKALAGSLDRLIKRRSSTKLASKPF
jgi:3-hydroxybutyryl-CoA dehydrogenase